MIKRNFFFAAVALTLFACSSGSDDPNPSSSSISAELTFDNIEYWVGEGENRAMLIIQWNDGKKPDAFAWGYRWEAGQTKTGYDMIDEIAKADQRLFYLRFYSGSYLGYAIAGIGYDSSGSSNIKLSNGGSCESLVEGSIDADSYDFDDWHLCNDANARWDSGWYLAYWSYWVSGSIDGKWEYSNLGASSRVLENNSVDAWYFDRDMSDEDLSTFYRCMMYGDDCNGKDFFGEIIPVNKPE